MSEEELEAMVVTVDEQHLSTIQTVAVALQSAGMKVEQILSTAGIITGTAPATAIGTLKNIEGVVDVEPDEPMQAI